MRTKKKNSTSSGIILVKKFISEEMYDVLVNFMYTKSEIEEIFVEIDQCMCCSSPVIIIG